MSKRIIAIAPYKELKDMYDEVLQELGIEEIETTACEMEIAAQYAIEAKKQGKEIVISRGGTARFIRDNANITVVEIKVTGYDLLRVLYKYVGTSKRIGVLGYSNVISGAKTIADILGIDIQYFVVEEEKGATYKTREAIQKGIDIIVGDVVAVRNAKQEGVDYDLIVSGKEAVVNAIQEARNLDQLTLKEREIKEQFKAILDFSSEGIIAVDREGIVTVYNPSAEKIFGIGREKVIDHKIIQAIPNSRIPYVLEGGKAELGSIQKTRDAHIITNRVPIVIKNEVRGVVATFQDITKVQELEEKIRKELSKRGLIAKHTFLDIVGKSPIIQRTIDIAKKFGKIDSTVLIYGESGTGKELFAQAIHNESTRKKDPFVAINCAALPSSLLESELFGYEEGAFTGARRGGKRGLFEIAHKGTIFLDEIGEMDIFLQARLLRVIQEREVMRLGGDKIIPVDVRIIAATNRDLWQQIREGKLREDLYYRLNVLNIEVPPLRERKEDIEELAYTFIKTFSQKYGCKVEGLDQEIVGFFKEYKWPGNIRELQNIIEKVVAICDEKMAQKKDLPEIFDLLVRNENNEKETGSIKCEEILEGTLAEIERRIIDKVLREEGYNKTKAAQRLGIDRVTINRKIKNK